MTELRLIDVTDCGTKVYERVGSPTPEEVAVAQEAAIRGLAAVNRIAEQEAQIDSLVGQGFGD